MDFGWNGKKKRKTEGGAKEVKAEGGTEVWGRLGGGLMARGQRVVRRGVASCFCFVFVDWDYLTKFQIRLTAQTAFSYCCWQTSGIPREENNILTAQTDKLLCLCMSVALVVVASSPHESVSCCAVCQSSATR